MCVVPAAIAFTPSGPGPKAAIAVESGEWRGSQDTSHASRHMTDFVRNNVYFFTGTGFGGGGTAAGWPAGAGPGLRLRPGWCGGARLRAEAGGAASRGWRQPVGARLAGGLYSATACFLTARLLERVPPRFVDHADDVVDDADEPPAVGELRGPCWSASVNFFARSLAGWWRRRIFRPSRYEVAAERADLAGSSARLQRSMYPAAARTPRGSRVDAVCDQRGRVETGQLAAVGEFAVARSARAHRRVRSCGLGVVGVKTRSHGRNILLDDG